jgi:hypothetical protein
VVISLSLTWCSTLVLKEPGRRSPRAHWECRLPNVLLGFRHAPIGWPGDDSGTDLGALGLTLVTVSHLIPIAMAYDLVPAYVAADPAGQARLAATVDTFAAIALVTNAAGNFLGWGVVVPLYAVPS